MGGSLSEYLQNVCTSRLCLNIILHLAHDSFLARYFSNSKTMHILKAFHRKDKTKNFDAHNPVLISRRLIENRHIHPSGISQHIEILKQLLRPLFDKFCHSPSSRHRQLWLYNNLFLPPKNLFGSSLPSLPALPRTSPTAFSAKCFVITDFATLLSPIVTHAAHLDSERYSFYYAVFALKVHDQAISDWLRHEDYRVNNLQFSPSQL